MRVVGFAALATLLTAPSAAGETFPWVEAGDIPLPEGVRSVEIRRHDEPLQRRPEKNPSARRGSAASGALLPLYGAERGPGCRGRWLLVGPTAWVCEDHVRLSRSAPMKPRKKPELFGDGLPLRYHFVGRNGSLGYAKLSLAEEGVPDFEYQPGFAVAVLQEANKQPGDPFGLTTKGLWLPMRDIAPVRPLTFEGVVIADGNVEGVAWVYEKSAPVYKKPGGMRRAGETKTKFQDLVVLETKTLRKRRWFRIGEDRWVSDRHVRVGTPAEMPAETLPGERWIDVDIATQVLTAYEGKTPVFATIVSTGKGRGKSILATPKGVHRVWVKLRTSDMTNLENEYANRYYAIQDVPWVMYFKKGYGLHGAFWHRSFGKVRSHGCVNLAPLDAQRLFHWAGPTLPTGWTAALPTDYDKGTLIRVR